MEEPNHRPGRLPLMLIWCAFFVSTSTYGAGAEARAKPAPGTDRKVRESLARIVDDLRGVRDLRATFRQTRILARLDEKIETTGTLLYARPRRFRLELGEPMPTHLYSDGKEWWVYFPALRQAERHSIGEAGPAAALFMWFDLSVDQILARFAPAAIDHREGWTAVTLTPMEEATRSVFTKLVVRFDDATGRRLGIEVTDAAGNATITSFGVLERNTGIPSSEFVFRPPPGVEVVKDRK